MLSGEQRRNQQSSFILLGLQQRKERPWPLSSYVYHFLITWPSAQEPDDFWAHTITNNMRKLQFYILSSAWTKTNQKPKQNQNLAQWLLFYSESVPQYCFPEVLMYWLATTMLLTLSKHTLLWKPPESFFKKLSATVTLPYQCKNCPEKNLWQTWDEVQPVWCRVCQKTNKE